MSDDPIKGAVQNGERVQVAFPWYTGLAGVQRGDDGLQVAYFSRAAVTLPATGHVGGVAVNVLAAERSKLVPGATVLMVQPIDAEPS